MTKLNELIQQLCPDGVEYKKLKNAVSIERGKRVVKSQLSQINGFPVYQNSLIPLGYHTECNYPANTTFIIMAGAAGEIGYSKESFWAADDCFSVVCPEEVSNRYIYHILLHKQEVLRSKVRKASIPRLSRNALDEIIVPLPPIEVQREIVRILDDFTEQTEQLKASLTAELTARKKQYEYYRDKLLTFDVFGGGTNRLEWKTLGESIISLSTGLNPRQFFKLNTEDAKNYYVTIREIQNGTIVFSEKTDRINDEALSLCNNRSHLEVGDVLFSGTGTIGETAIVSEVPTNWNIKEGVYAIKPKRELLNSRYLMYLLRTRYMQLAISKKVAGGTVKSIPMGDMRKLQIPVPDITVQESIVSILDRFDALCNDLTSGLPAEIAARQKQYEFYRDKLLTFKERLTI